MKVGVVGQEIIKKRRKRRSIIMIEVEAVIGRRKSIIAHPKGMTEKMKIE